MEILRKEMDEKDLKEVRASPQINNYKKIESKLA